MGDCHPEDDVASSFGEELESKAGELASDGNLVLYYFAGQIRRSSLQTAPSSLPGVYILFCPPAEKWRATDKHIEGSPKKCRSEQTSGLKDFVLVRALKIHHMHKVVAQGVELIAISHC